jgi:hypothetical protein
LRLLALSLYHCDDDFSALGGPHIDDLDLARQSAPFDILHSLEIAHDIDSILRVQASPRTRDRDAQHERLRKAAQGSAGKVEHSMSPHASILATVSCLDEGSKQEPLPNSAM